MKVLLEETSITISCDEENHWLVADWKGYQTVESIRFGCEEILKFLIQYKLTKVLNNNSLVTGIWSGASAWVGNEWFPRMIQAGLKKFAWVYSKSALSRLSTDESLKNLENKSATKTFFEISDAIEWLKKDDNQDLK